MLICHYSFFSSNFTHLILVAFRVRNVKPSTIFVFCLERSVTKSQCTAYSLYIKYERDFEINLLRHQMQCLFNGHFQYPRFIKS